jgi:hypothetical protein
MVERLKRRRLSFTPMRIPDGLVFFSSPSFILPAAEKKRSPSPTTTPLVKLDLANPADKARLQELARVVKENTEGAIAECLKEVARLSGRAPLSPASSLCTEDDPSRRTYLTYSLERAAIMESLLRDDDESDTCSSE